METYIILISCLGRKVLLGPCASAFQQSLYTGICSTVSKKSCDLLQNAANLWKENCSVNKRLDQVKKQLAQAGKTEMHQRYSENLHQSFLLQETSVFKMLLLLFPDLSLVDEFVLQW